MTTSKTKTNYSESQTNAIVSAMRENTSHIDQVESILVLAADLEKTTRSISAKMSSLSRSADYDDLVFFKKPATTKTGSPVMSKDKMVAKIADRINGVEQSDLDSLAKVTKNVLNILLAAIPKESLGASIDQLGELSTGKDQAL